MHSESRDRFGPWLTFAGIRSSSSGLSRIFRPISDPNADEKAQPNQEKDVQHSIDPEIRHMGMGIGYHAAGFNCGEVFLLHRGHYRRHSEINLLYIQISKNASLDYKAIYQRSIGEALFEPSR
jgi:hypothetical protein